MVGRAGQRFAGMIVAFGKGRKGRCGDGRRCGEEMKGRDENGEQWEVACFETNVWAQEVFERAFSSTMIEGLIADAPRRQKYGVEFLKRLT